MLEHSSIGHGLVKIGSNSVGPISSNYNTAHAALLQSFCDLAKEFIWSIIVRIDNDNFANVFLTENIDGWTRMRSFSQLAAVV